MNSFVLCAIVILSFYIFVFIIGLLLKNNSIVDMAWGLGFIILAGVCALVFGLNSFEKITMVIMICVWGVWFSFFAFKNNYKMPEKLKHQKMRGKWKNKVALYSFFEIYILKALLTYIIALPIMFIFQFMPVGGGVWIALTSILFFLIGLIIQILYNLPHKKFAKNPNKKAITDALSVGEILIWWAICLLAISYYYGYATIISPIIMTCLVMLNDYDLPKINAKK